MSSTCTVTFTDSSTRVVAPFGSTVLEAARMAGVDIVASCNGRGTCGSCSVWVRAGLLDTPDEVEQRLITRSNKPVRFACRARLIGDVSVEPVIKIRSSSLASSQEKFGGAKELEASAVTNPENAVITSRAPLNVIAVDFGTTSVSAAVIDANACVVLAERHVRNHQIKWGSDILTRLSASLQGEREQIRDAGQETILAALRDMLSSDNEDAVNLEQLLSRTQKISISANTVMTALLAGVDATSLSVAPFEPVVVDAVTDGPLFELVDSVAAEQGRRRPRIALTPPLGKFVGGDIRAAIVGVGMAKTQGASRQVLIDIGTNVEVVVRAGDDLCVVSAPAGSAFEGALGSGAMIPSSLLVSAIARLVRDGCIDASGAFVGEDGLYRNAEEVLSTLVVVDEREIELTQLDIRNFQLAKAALVVAIGQALSQAQVAPTEVGQVFIAGAFGQALDPNDAFMLGLFPESFRGKTRVVGNASLSGTVELALGASEHISGRVQTLDLAQSPEFSEKLIAALDLKPAR